MLDHVSLTVADLERAERFYDAIFTALGVPKVGSDHANAWIGYGERSDAEHPERSYFSVRLGPRPDDAPRRHCCCCHCSPKAGLRSAALCSRPIARSGWQSAGKRGVTHCSATPPGLGC